MNIKQAEWLENWKEKFMPDLDLNAKVIKNGKIKTMKKENYKCRQNTCFIRIYKTSRTKLKKVAKKKGITIQDLVVSICG